MERVTMQELADALNVSRITVWKALTNRPGVSEAMREQVQKKAEELGYAQTPHPLTTASARHTFSVVVSRPESSSFWNQIIHNIAKELAAQNINLMYTYMPSSYRPGFMLPPSLDETAVDGFIVLNIYDRTLLRMLTQHTLPKVFLDTVPTVPAGELNGDLLLLEGRASVCEITKRLLLSGRRRVGFIGDVNYAQTNYDRYLGYLDAHTACHITVDPALCMTKSIGLRSHFEEISQFLSLLPVVPDAFVCPSDFIAHFISRYYQETAAPNGRMPVLTGFDNNAEYANVADQITTVNVNTSALGKRLARQLIYRVDYPHAPFETSFISTEIVFRGPLSEKAEGAGV